MNGELVGEWRRPARRGPEFAYAESWLAAPAARPISLSLPLRPHSQPYRKGVEEFFDNLLPDSRAIRERIQRRFGATSVGAFDLLQEIGRDCVGALQLLPEGHSPVSVRSITAQRLTAGGVENILIGSLTPGLGRGAQDEASDEFRISLAGAQEKTALLRHEGAWYRPIGSTPTTHILKLPIGGNPQGIDLSTSVENEWLCAQIARGFGIPVAECSMETFGEQKALVVERFDRALTRNGKWYMRLPQEDFCQATGTAPVRKHESDGGPGIEKRCGTVYTEDAHNAFELDLRRPAQCAPHRDAELVAPDVRVAGLHKLRGKPVTRLAPGTVAIEHVRLVFASPHQPCNLRHRLFWRGVDIQRAGDMPGDEVRALA